MKLKLVFTANSSMNVRLNGRSPDIFTFCPTKSLDTPALDKVAQDHSTSVKNLNISVMKSTLHYCYFYTKKCCL